MKKNLVKQKKDAGRIGGLKTKERLGSDHYSKAARKRWRLERKRKAAEQLEQK